MSGFTTWSYILNGLRTGNWQWKPYNRTSYANVILGNTPVSIRVDENDLMRAYLDCPVLQTVINRRAQMFSNGQWKCISTTDEEQEFEDDEFLKLLRKPNPIQRGNMWLYQYSLYHDIYNSNIIYPLRATSISQPTCLWHLPNDAMKLILSGRYYQQSKLENIITQFVLLEGGTEQVFKTDEIIYNVQNPDKQFRGISKILSLKLPISNVIAAYETRNQLIISKGVQAIISNESKDADGGLPLDETERTRLNEAWRDRSNIYSSKAPYEITTAAVKVQMLSYPTKDLALFEEIEDDVMAICGAYDVMRDALPSAKGATFENQSQAQRGTYEHGIQPVADDLGDLITHMVFPDGSDRKYVLDYSWLPCMQEDELVNEQSEKTKVERLSILLRDNIIDAKQYAELAGVDFTGTGQTQHQMQIELNNTNNAAA